MNKKLLVSYAVIIAILIIYGYLSLRNLNYLAFARVYWV